MKKIFSKDTLSSSFSATEHSQTGLPASNDGISSRKSIQIMLFVARGRHQYMNMSITVNAQLSFGDLKVSIAALTQIPEKMLKLSTGFSKESIALSDSESIYRHIKNGDQVYAEMVRLTNPKTAPSPNSKIPAAISGGGLQFKTIRIIVHVARDLSKSNRQYLAVSTKLSWGDLKALIASKAEVPASKVNVSKGTRKGGSVIPDNEIINGHLVNGDHVYADKIQECDNAIVVVMPPPSVLSPSARAGMCSNIETIKAPVQIVGKMTLPPASFGTSQQLSTSPFAPPLPLPIATSKYPSMPKMQSEHGPSLFKTIRIIVYVSKEVRKISCLYLTVNTQCSCWDLRELIAAKIEVPVDTLNISKGTRKGHVQLPNDESCIHGIIVNGDKIYVTKQNQADDMIHLKPVPVTPPLTPSIDASTEMMKASVEVDDHKPHPLPSAPLEETNCAELGEMDHSSTRSRSDSSGSFIFDEDDFRDPLTFEVMADPVNCEDGYTYDRSSLERHFQLQLELEDERLEEEARKARGENILATREDACGARPPIELTSPFSGEILSGNLVPNRTLERQIERLVQENRLAMSEEDLADWHDRRELKRVGDRRRAEERRQEQLRRQQMRRNADEAARRRSVEVLEETCPTTEAGQGVQAPTDEPPNQSHNAQAVTQVRLDPHDMQCREELVRGGSLGVSIMLSIASQRAPLEIASSRGRVPRCMVACCAKRIEEDPQWCARCGRVVCKTCLCFKVGDISQQPSTLLHRICSECVSQLVDAMDSDDVGMGQARSVILHVHLPECAVTLTNRASNLQDLVAHAEADDEFGPGIRQLEVDIERIRQTKITLMNRIQEAHERVEKARKDDEAARIAALESTSLDFQRRLEYAESLPSPNGEKGQLAHVIAISTLAAQLDEAQLQLGIARSSFRDCHAVKPAIKRGKMVAACDDTTDVDITCTPTPTNIANMALVREDLNMIGKWDEWPLPLGLSFPTTRMEHQVESLHTTMKLRLMESQRQYDELYSSRFQQLTKRRDALEDQLFQLTAEWQDAQANAAEQEQQLEHRRQEEAQRAHEREQRRRNEETARRERERLRLVSERRARQEAEQLRQRHAANEEATRRTMASVVGRSGNAAVFGGRGDLRMCRRCKAGPIENFACSDLGAHNNSATTYKGSFVASRRNPNHCPNCDWFDSNWQNWPYWDGIYGPH
jgi:hypothetical protein